MTTNVLVTGATGFTGSFVVQELLRRGISFDCLVRSSSDIKHLKSLGLTLLEGDLQDIDSLLNIFPSYKVLINVASLGSGCGPTIVQACQQSGIKRGVFISTTAIFTQLNAKSKVIRQAAEDSIRSSNLNYTILRPTMIYGTPRDRNMIRLLRLLEKFAIIPVPGSGKFLQQPVHVEDVAWSICEVLNNEKTYGRDYNISGGQVLSYNEVIKTASKALGKEPTILHISAKLSILMIQTANILGFKKPISAEQIMRLNEDKVFDHTVAKEDFNYTPRSFSEGIAQEVAILLGNKVN